jgi:hypothetical protein
MEGGALVSLEVKEEMRTTKTYILTLKLMKETLDLWTLDQSVINEESKSSLPYSATKGKL